MSMLTAGFKKVRKTLHLPPVTLKNVATKYAPVALGVAGLAGTGPAAGLLSKIPGAAAVKGAASKAGGVLSPVTDRLKKIRKAAGLPPITLKNTLGGAASSALGAAARNPIETIGAIAAAKSGADAFKRAGDYQNKAIAGRQQSYDERAGLRKLGVSGMSKPTAAAPQAFVNRSNPFTPKKKRVL